MDPFVCAVMAIAAGIVGVLVGLKFHYIDVENRVKLEKNRLEQVDKTKEEVNRALSGSEMIGTHDFELERMDTSHLLFVRSILCDVNLAERMRADKKANAR